MNLMVIENNPKFKHTISPEETTFIASIEDRDFYYRNNGFNHNVDIRYSDEPSDYVTWSMKSISKLYFRNFEEYNKIIPAFIYDKAMEISS